MKETIEEFEIIDKKEGIKKQEKDFFSSFENFKTYEKKFESQKLGPFQIFFYKLFGIIIFLFILSIFGLFFLIKKFGQNLEEFIFLITKKVIKIPLWLYLIVFFIGFPWTIFFVIILEFYKILKKNKL